MMAEPLISVLMSTYKESCEYLRIAIDSILNQTYSNIELIIIEDDPNNSEAKKLISEYAETDERIKIVENEKNIGLVNSLNKGIKYCNGQYIARMDADDCSVAERFAIQLSFLQGHHYDLVGSNFILMDKDGNTDSNEIFSFPENNKSCKDALKRFNCIQHPTWLATKDVFTRLGGYRNILHVEDYDFICRASLCGFKIGNCQSALLKYRFSQSSISRRNSAEQELIAALLSSYYVRHKVLPIEEYHDYINSQRYKDKLKKFKRAFSLLDELKSSRVGRMSFLYRAFITPSIHIIMIKRILNKIMSKWS